MSASTSHVALLRTNRDFRLMWAGQFIAAVGRDAAFVINAASFTLSAVCTCLVQTRTETDVWQWVGSPVG